MKNQVLVVFKNNITPFTQHQIVIQANSWTLPNTVLGNSKFTWIYALDYDFGPD